jgi:Flp pilus assembly pilin Flp
MIIYFKRDCRECPAGRIILNLTTHGYPVMMLVQPEESMGRLMRSLWFEEEGQDIAEYAVMLAVILVLVVGTVRLIGGNANNAFSQTASSIAQ